MVKCIQLKEVLNFFQLFQFDFIFIFASFFFLKDLHFAPFTDLALYIEQINKSNFWYQQSFHGVDLSCLRDAAVKEYFKQPIVDTFDISICMAKSQCYSVDFLTADEQDLHNIDIPFEFKINQNGEVHGLAFW